MCLWAGWVLAAFAVCIQWEARPTAPTESQLSPTKACAMLVPEAPLDAYRSDLARDKSREDFGGSDTVWLLTAHCLSRMGRATAQDLPMLGNQCASALRDFTEPSTDDAPAATGSPPVGHSLGAPVSPASMNGIDNTALRHAAESYWNAIQIASRLKDSRSESYGWALSGMSMRCSIDTMKRLI